MSKVIDSLKNAGKTQFSFELLPPLKGHSIEEIYKSIDPLVGFNPININMTFHQPETVYNQLPDGSIEKKVVRKRPGTLALVAAIKFRYNVPVVPHVICGGHTKDDIEDYMIDFNFLGIKDVLLLRGDAPRGQKIFMPEKTGHAHTVDLVKQVKNMNKGIYLDPTLKNPAPTDFCIGVAGYPEKHIEAPNLDTDLKHLKAKVDAGADYIVTQLFYDNKAFFEFVKKCREAGITVPIVPGIKPTTLMSDLKLLPQIFAVNIPQELVNMLEKCKTNQDVREVGIEWTIAQCRELIKFGVPVIHFYTYGQTDNIAKIAKEIF